jgi:hypothetical protein
VANTILTPQVITNELLRRFKNNLGFASSIHHEYDDRFANKGGKIGDTLQLRVPVKFTATKAVVLSEQDVTETSVPLTLDTQAHVGFSFGSKDLTLTIDKFGERYLDSASLALANVVDVDGLTLAYQSTSNAVGTPGTVPSALKTYNQAGAKLDDNGAPLDDQRHMVVNPTMQVEIVDALKALFQSSPQIKRQYEKGRMGMAAGFNWILDQNVRTHTVGPLGGTPLVNGASQTGASLVTDGWTASAANRLKKGDIFTIAAVCSAPPAPIRRRASHITAMRSRSRWLRLKCRKASTWPLARRTRKPVCPSAALASTTSPTTSSSIAATSSTAGPPAVCSLPAA